jgi:branched-chain amino acid transport system permease protein
MDLTKRLLERFAAAVTGSKETAEGRGAPETKALLRRRLAIVAIAGTAILPLLPFVPDYWIDVGFYCGIYALLGLSLNVVLGEVGLFDLGHTAFYAIGAYVTAILNTRFHVPILLLAPVSALAAALFAWLVTSPVIHLKGDYLCIVTIGIGEIVRLTMINNPFGLTGGPNGINGIDTPWLIVPIVSSRQFYYLVWALIGIAAAGLSRLQRSRIGRAWNFIREDETAAEALGIDVRRFKLAAFVTGAGLAGLAGTLYASKQMSVSPESFTFMESSLLFCIVLLGGLGSIPGSILGAAVITVFPEVFRPFAKYRLMFFGLALLAMMIFKPAGLIPRRRQSWREILSGLGKNPHEESAGGSFVKAVPHSRIAETGQGGLLEISGLELSFGGVRAVSGMDARVERGRITALIGPNGAGKTTVFNLITGIYRPKSGSIRFSGESLLGRKPHEIAYRGIARTFQNIRIFPNLTCLENVLCGQHCRGSAGFAQALFRSVAQRKEEHRMTDVAQRCLSIVGLEGVQDLPASALPYGKRRYLEIARALATEPELIVLDEPSSGLNDQETEELSDLLRKILDHGISILLIEHDMNLVDSVSDHVIVMQSGRKIAEGAMCDLRRDRAVVEAYLGSEED